VVFTAIVVVRWLVPQDDPVAARIGPGAVLIALAGVAVFTLVNWRCPACRKFLGFPMTGRRRRSDRCEAAFE
jgi:hypothetical protein